MKKFLCLLLTSLLLVAGCSATTSASDSSENSNTEETPTETTRETDVLVVGSGIAGLTAALSAAESGANVIVLEKQGVLGGTTAIAGGYLICVESEFFADSDFDDSLETFREYWDTRMSYSGAESGYPDEERWEEIVSKTGSTVDWLVENGVSFNEEVFTGFGAYPVAAHTSGGAGLVSDLQAACENAGVEIIAECKAESLIIDENGKVTGVNASNSDGSITFKAGSVVLATGGISQNADLVSQYSPKVAKAQTISFAASGSTGDGLLMALEAGAQPFDEFFTAIWATTVDPELTAAVSEASALTTNAQLGVNANGERFASEAAVYTDALGSDMIQDGNAPFYYIYDSSDEEITAVLEAGVEANVVLKGETIAELAEAMNVDADTLQATYDRYQSLAASGNDEDYGKAADLLVSLDAAPFYAVKFYPTTFGSMGGVETDLDGHVLDAEGNPIEGLFAAGEMSNRYYYNENYVLAASLGLYATTGRLTGAAAAAEAK